jgi:hypothetical protein
MFEETGCVVVFWTGDLSHPLRRRAGCRLAGGDLAATRSALIT